MRFPALLLLCLLIGCEDKPVVERPRLDIADTTVSGMTPDTTALDSLLDTLPVTSVETLVTVVPVVDTTVTVEIDTTTKPDTTILVVIDSTPRGIPTGAFAAWGQPSADQGVHLGASQPATIVNQITEARAKRTKLILALTGGGHGNYLSVIRDTLRFDRTKWDARLALYDTPVVRKAIRQGVRDGTVLGAYVMDEPNVTGQGDGNTWGPRGTLTKARVDSLCAAVKEKFPELPVGVAHNHDTFEPDSSYRVCEFLIDQYATRKGDARKWRDAGLAMARRDGMAVVFSLNTLAGGTQAKRDGTWNCGSVGRGTYDPTCRMTPKQIVEWGALFGPPSCALLYWRYDSGMMRDTAYQRAFREVADLLKRKPTKPCRRS